MRKLERTEIRMLRLKCAVRLQGRLTNADLRNRAGIWCIGDVVRSSRLRWFRHVERKPEEDWVKKMLTFEVESKRLRGRPKKTRMEVINNDLRGLNANRTDAPNRTLWRRIIRKEDRRTWVTFRDHLDGHTSKKFAIDMSVPLNDNDDDDDDDDELARLIACKGRL